MQYSIKNVLQMRLYDTHIMLYTMRVVSASRGERYPKSATPWVDKVVDTHQGRGTGKVSKLSKRRKFCMCMCVQMWQDASMYGEQGEMRGRRARVSKWRGVRKTGFKMVAVLGKVEKERWTEEVRIWVMHITYEFVTTPMINYIYTENFEGTDWELALDSRMLNSPQSHIIAHVCSQIILYRGRHWP